MIFLFKKMFLVIRLDGSVPVKYGLRLPMDTTYLLLKERLTSLCDISSDHLLFAEVSGAMIKVNDDFHF